MKSKAHRIRTACMLGVAVTLLQSCTHDKPNAEVKPIEERAELRTHREMDRRSFYARVAAFITELESAESESEQTNTLTGLVYLMKRYPSIGKGVQVFGKDENFNIVSWMSTDSKVKVKWIEVTAGDVVNESTRPFSGTIVPAKGTNVTTYLHQELQDFSRDWESSH